jgi:hypothetical protein
MWEHIICELLLVAFYLFPTKSIEESFTKAICCTCRLYCTVHILLCTVHWVYWHIYPHNKKILHLSAYSTCSEGQCYARALSLEEKWCSVDKCNSSSRFPFIGWTRDTYRRPGTAWLGCWAMGTLKVKKYRRGKIFWLGCQEGIKSSCTGTTSPTNQPRKDPLICTS